MNYNLLLQPGNDQLINKPTHSPGAILVHRAVSVHLLLSENTLQDPSPLDNIFLGLNWEIIRGVSIFGGRHFGKVNTFEETQGFKFSDTFISEEAFQLRQDTKRKSNWSFGLNLDVRIITNLFQNSSAGS